MSNAGDKSGCDGPSRNHPLGAGEPYFNSTQASQARPFAVARYKKRRPPVGLRTGLAVAPAAPLQVLRVECT